MLPGCVSLCGTFNIQFENNIARGLSAPVSSGCFISETSHPFSHSRSLFELFIPFNHRKKKKRVPLSLLLLLLHLHIAYLVVSGQQCHTDSSVLCLSLVLYNEFCLGRDILQFGLYSGAKREWETWISEDENTACIDGTSLSPQQQEWEFLGCEFYFYAGKI